MTLAIHLVLAVGLLAVALYAQYRIPYHTAGRRKILLTRGVLALVGLLLGYVYARLAPDHPAAMLALIQGFGLVHVPAALILFFKKARHEGRS